jgi:phosphonate transport system substrate-binding protein
MIGARWRWRSRLAALALALLPGAGLAVQEVRFAPLPMEDARIIHEQFRGLADYLQEAAGVRLRWVILADNQQIVEHFKAGEIDLAYLGPLPHVLLRRDHPAAEMLGCFRDANGEVRYTCSLLVAGDSGLTPERLRGVRIGLTQPYSTCGYLAVSQMLRRAGTGLDRDGNTFAYTGSHSEAALALARGEFDVVGVKTGIAQRYLHLDLKVIATSEPYPGFALVANGATLPPAVVAALRQAVVELDPGRAPALAARMRDWAESVRGGAAPAEQCDYAAVGEALRDLPWPIPGARSRDP